jgi:hypothetical protein
VRFFRRREAAERFGTTNSFGARRLPVLLGSALAMTVALALVVSLPPPMAGQGGVGKGKARAPKGQPAPRRADGKIDFSGVYHSPGYGPDDPRPPSGESTAKNIARFLRPDEVPMQPWAKELVHKRYIEDESKDDPEGFCMPMGTPRTNPYPIKILQTDKLLVILYEGNVHSYRQVFLDGRAHDPTVKETAWGDSIGTWDGDALVIDTVGLGFGDGRGNRAWLDAAGHPRTNKLHVIERLTRPELGFMMIETTIDDPGAYTKPWKVVERAQLAPGWEIQENICNENQDANGQNLDAQHLLSLPAGIGKK